MLKNFFKAKKSKPVLESDASSGDTPEDEYQIPSLHRKDIIMTSDIQQRMRDEQLRIEYGITLPKVGYFL